MLLWCYEFLSMIFVFRRIKFLLRTHNQRNCKQFQIQWELGHCTTKIDVDRLCRAFAQQKCWPTEF